MKTKLLLAAVILFSLSAFAQTDSQTPMKVEPMAQTPTFRVTVVSRTAKAINYPHRGGATKVDFQGTELMPKASGEAKVESKQGYMEIEVEFDELQKATTFGHEYLTYVLWAITPQGRAVNLGELLLNGNRGKLNVTTDLQAFALLVTAEPYFAVRQPSNLVVLENVVRADTAGTTQAVNAKYELMERGGYIPTGYKFDPVILSVKLPLEFFEARNALRIAESEGAARYANDSYQRAVKLMDRADALAATKKPNKKVLIATSREAVQVAEDARAIAVQRIEEERLANERQASAEAQASSREAAEEATRQKELAQAEAERAERARAENQAASAEAVSAAQAEAEKSRLATLQAEQDALEARQAAEQAALQAQQAAEEAEREQAAKRARLTEQLNTVLQTRDSARGLIVSMSDVLFDSGKHALKPGARERLAKVAGILLAYPGLAIEVGGYTDSVGGDEMNQRLSENRAGSVRDYLVQQGVSAESVTATGFGETQPVATNDTSAGRRQNRRVELVVSGEAIGDAVGATTGRLR